MNDDKLMVADVSPAKTFVATTPRVLLATTYAQGVGLMRNYDISRDGKRFIMIKPDIPDAAAVTELTILVNWMSHLRHGEGR